MFREHEAIVRYELEDASSKWKIDIFFAFEGPTLTIYVNKYHCCLEAIKVAARIERNFARNTPILVCEDEFLPQPSTPPQKKRRARGEIRDDTSRPNMLPPVPVFKKD